MAAIFGRFYKPILLNTADIVATIWSIDKAQKVLDFLAEIEMELIKVREAKSFIVSNVYAEMTPEYKKTLLKQMHKSEVAYEFGKDKIAELKDKPDKTQKEIEKLARKETDKTKDDNTLANWKAQLQAEGVTDFDQYRDEAFDEMEAKANKDFQQWERQKEEMKLIPNVHSTYNEDGVSMYDAEIAHYNKCKKAHDDKVKKIKKLKKEKSKW